MPKTIIIDFDHTLFNAQLFKKDLAKALGMSLTSWEKDYQKNKKKYKHYNYKEQIKNLSLTKQKKLLNILKKAKKYLYRDAMRFLRQNHPPSPRLRRTSEGTKRTKNTKIMILSKGEPSFQKQKIMNTGVKKYAKIITTDQSKKKFIKKMGSKRDIVFINDRGQEIDEIKKAFPKVQAIWVRRKNGQYKNEPCKKFNKKVNNLIIKL